MAVIIQLIYVAFCIGLAYSNYRTIKANEPVEHGINGLGHVAFWVVAYLISNEWLLLFILPLLGGVVFDIALNLFRGLPINYSSSTSTSIVDKWERKVFNGDGYANKIVYLIIAIVLNFCL
ncbi:MAG TPA: hypothetical protein VFS31_03445 [Chitinophagaceae bacterium]|nr:hypothetical protein [Chitinophagaceae bacterium]